MPKYVCRGEIYNDDGDEAVEKTYEADDLVEATFLFYKDYETYPDMVGEVGYTDSIVGLKKRAEKAEQEAERVKTQRYKVTTAVQEVLYECKQALVKANTSIIAAQTVYRETYDKKDKHDKYPY